MTATGRKWRRCAIFRVPSDLAHPLRSLYRTSRFDTKEIAMKFENLMLHGFFAATLLAGLLAVGGMLARPVASSGAASVVAPAPVVAAAG